MKNMIKTTHQEGVGLWTDDDLERIRRRSKVFLSALPSLSNVSGWADNFDAMCCRQRSYHSTFHRLTV